MDLGDLENDTKFRNLTTKLDEYLNKIDNSLTIATEDKDFEELPPEEKVNLLNYLAYSSNSLYWMYLKLNGVDVNEHGIKNELSRVRKTLVREQQIRDHKTIRPQLNKEVAARFVKHELNIPRDKETDNSKSIQT